VISAVISISTVSVSTKQAPSKQATTHGHDIHRSLAHGKIFPHLATYEEYEFTTSFADEISDVTPFHAEFATHYRFHFIVNIELTMRQPAIS
jgi:hypothetical protein